jgi:hypothetical protein
MGGWSRGTSRAPLTGVIGGPQNTWRAMTSSARCLLEPVYTRILGSHLVVGGVIA